MPLTLEQFADKIDLLIDATADIVEAVVAPAGDGPKAKVFRRYVFDRDEEQWAGLLKSEESADDVRAWLISFGGIGGNWPATTGQAAPLVTLTVDFFRRFQLGTDESNSEREMRREAAMVWWALALRPKLGLPADLVERHNLLQLPIKLGAMGAQEMHKGFGTLGVQMARLNIR